MEIKLVCMDLDGTALQSDRSSFSPRLTAALEAAHTRGIAIAPVTGRQYGLLPPAVTCHPIWENLVVTCNGGQVYRLGTGECLLARNIGEAALRQLIAIAERFDLPLEFSVDSRLHLTQASYDAQLPHENLHFHVHTILAKSGVIVDSLEPLCTRSVEKAQLPWIPPALASQVEAALKDVAVSAVWSSSTSMELTHPDASKGNGLAALCRLLNIPMEQTIALGDSGNDESMLRAAGIGVAMGNAPDFIKAIADAVSEPHDRDGAALAIERFCL
ncbi:MAG: HAD family phosphatase [Oscillospiraceae bacterium]|nr:HAD family phosphatase [Oscillospiraceae bacterium]